MKKIRGKLIKVYGKQESVIPWITNNECKELEAEIEVSDQPKQECECSQYNDYGGIKCGNCGKYIKATQPQVPEKILPEHYANNFEKMLIKKYNELIDYLKQKEE